MNKILTFSYIFLSFIQPIEKERLTDNLPKRNIEKLLTRHKWMAEEIKSQLSDNTYQYYKRGSNQNSVDYDTDVLQFNKKIQAPIILKAGSFQQPGSSLTRRKQKWK